MRLSDGQLEDLRQEVGDGFHGAHVRELVLPLIAEVCAARKVLAAARAWCELSGWERGEDLRAAVAEYDKDPP